LSIVFNIETSIGTSIGGEVLNTISSNKRKKKKKRRKKERDFLLVEHLSRTPLNNQKIKT
jgi:hypothetical protein